MAIVLLDVFGLFIEGGASFLYPTPLDIRYQIIPLGIIRANKKEVFGWSKSVAACNTKPPMVIANCSTTKDESFKDIIQVISIAATASDRFWRALYAHGIWIPREVGEKLVENGWLLTDTEFILYQNIFFSLTR